MGEGFVESHHVGLMQSASNCGDRERSVPCDDFGNFAGLGEGLAVGDHMADEADFERFPGRDVLRREQDLGGLGVRNLAGKPDS